jgi:VID27 PH-like domain
MFSLLFCDLYPYCRNPTVSNKLKSRKAATKDDATALSAAMKSLSVHQTTPDAGKRPAFPLIPESFPQLVSHPAELYVWDLEQELFNPLPTVIAKIVQRPDSYDYWLLAESCDEPGDQMFAHKITSEMNQRWSNKMRSLTWNYVGSEGEHQSWLFRFAETKAYEEFLFAYTRATWEGLNQVSWAKAKAWLSMLTSMFITKMHGLERRTRICP